MRLIHDKHTIHTYSVVFRRNEIHTISRNRIAHMLRFDIFVYAKVKLRNTVTSVFLKNNVLFGNSRLLTQLKFA